MQAREEFHKAATGPLGRALTTATLMACIGCVAGDEPPREEAGALLAATAPVVAAGPPAGHAWIIFGADTVLAEVVFGVPAR